MADFSTGSSMKELASRSGFIISSPFNAEKILSKGDDPSKKPEQKKEQDTGTGGNREGHQPKPQTKRAGSSKTKDDKSGSSRKSLTSEDIAAKSGFVVTSPAIESNVSSSSSQNFTDGAKIKTFDNDRPDDSKASRNKKDRDDRKGKHNKKQERTLQKGDGGRGAHTGNDKSGGNIVKSNGFTVTGLDNPKQVTPKQEKEKGADVTKLAGFTITGLNNPEIEKFSGSKQDKRGQKSVEPEVKKSLFSRLEASSNVDTAADPARKNSSHREISIANPASNNAKTRDSRNNDAHQDTEKSDKRLNIKKAPPKHGGEANSFNSGYNKRPQEYLNFSERSRPGGNYRGPPANGPPPSLGAPPPPTATRAPKQSQSRPEDGKFSNKKTNQISSSARGSLDSFTEVATELDEASKSPKDNNVSISEVKERSPAREAPKKQTPRPNLLDDKPEKASQPNGKKAAIISHKIPLPMKTNSRWANDALRPASTTNTKVVNKGPTTSADQIQREAVEQEPKPHTYGLAEIVAKKPVEKKVEEKVPPKVGVKAISNWADSSDSDDE